MTIAPVVLEGGNVRLEPIGPTHLERLEAQARMEPEIFAWMSTGNMGEPGRLRAFIERATAELAAGREIGFAVLDRRTNEPLGTSSMYRVDPVHRVLEIGRTWYAARARRTAVNTQAKRLLFEHAFETLGAHRVELRTDSRNLRSRSAIERVGATFEGIIRYNVIMPDGYVRDTASFAIVSAEWPDVRARLDSMLLAPRGSRT